jgi:hypothetical protein
VTAPSPGPGPMLRPARPFGRVWAVSSLTFFALGLLWAFATPLGAAPDEPTQIVKAAAVVRAEFIGQPAPGQPKAVTEVTVPASFADDARLATCFAGRPTVPAGCAPHLSSASTPTEVGTYVGRYPPLYYLLVGVPTLLWRGSGAVLAMRALSALWSAALLGLAVAIAAVWSRSRLLVLGLAVAVTPLVIFLTAVVNPSGLEIAAAVATWTGALVLVLDHRRHAPAPLVAATAASGCVLALCRGLSDLWLAAIAAFAVALVPAALGQLGRQQLVRRAALWPTVVAAAAAIWVLAASTLSVVPDGIRVARRSSTFDLVVDALGRLPAIAHQAVGVFGWLDTPSPYAVEAAWAAVAAIVVIGGTLTTRQHLRRVVLALVATSVVLPTAIIVSQAARDGLVWQARDGMPLYAGVPIMAAAVADRVDRGRLSPGRSLTTAATRADPGAIRRLAGLVAAAVAACQWLDFAWALRRYTVGLGGPLAPWRHVTGGWQPPVPTVVLLVAAGIVAIAYGRWLDRLAAEAADATAVSWASAAPAGAHLAADGGASAGPPAADAPGTAFGKAVVCGRLPVGGERSPVPRAVLVRSDQPARGLRPARQPADRSEGAARRTSLAPPSRVRLSSLLATTVGREATPTVIDSRRVHTDPAAHGQSARSRLH